MCVTRRKKQSKKAALRFFSGRASRMCVQSDEGFIRGTGTRDLGGLALITDQAVCRLETWVWVARLSPSPKASEPWKPKVLTQSWPIA